MTQSVLLNEAFENLLRNFSNLIQDIKIYPAGHPEITRKMEQIFQHLHVLFDEISEIIFAIIDEEIIFQNKPLIDLSNNLKPLIAFFQKNQIAKVSIFKEVTQDEMLEFSKLLIDNQDNSSNSVSWDEILTQNQILHIKCSALYIPQKKLSGSSESSENLPPYLLEISHLISELGKDKIQELNEVIQLGQALDYDYLLSQINQLTPQILKHYNELIFLGTLKSHSQNSFDHVINVAVLSALIGAALSFPESSLDELCVAAFLHDIGKKKIPLSILEKPGKLTEKERAIIETHPEQGAKMVLLEEDIREMAVIISFEHHLNYDQTGYPSLFKARIPSIISRIVMIADFYDALRGTRIYKGEMAPEDVYSLMQDLKGSKFDPFILDLFFQVIGVYPPGIEVKLDSGETGIVIKSNVEDIFRPVVKLVVDRNGLKMKDTVNVSLIDKTKGKYIRSISKSIPPCQSEQNFQKN